MHFGFVIGYHYATWLHIEILEQYLSAFPTPILDKFHGVEYFYRVY